MLSEEQESTIKNQLLEHIEKSFPEEKKQYAKEQVEQMDSDELEKFLKNNNLIAGHENQCVFCSIVHGDIPSYNLEEIPEAIAVLEINPVSKGHCLIIPKQHPKENSEMPKEAEKLAKKITRRIKTKLKPKKVDVVVSNMFGHDVINIIPVYSDENLSSKRNPARKEELEEVQTMLKPKSSEKKKTAKKPGIKKIIEKFEQKLWLPQRIP